MGLKAALARLAQALLGMALLQLALPKLLPLPGVSTLWLLVVPDGGSFARLAALVGGALLAAVGAAQIPPGYSARHLALLSAGVAVGGRALAAGLALGAGLPLRWGPGAGGPGLLVGLALVALVYGALAFAVARTVEAARRADSRLA